jgi:uncharacterized repeat protein (TIGR04076 family)
VKGSTSPIRSWNLQLRCLAAVDGVETPAAATVALAPAARSAATTAARGHFFTSPSFVLGPRGARGSPDYAPLVPEMRLFDLRVTVERIEGRSVCGLQVGDYFELTESSRLRIPEGKHFCLYALQSVLPLLPAKQRRLPEEDWLEQDSLVCCPDPEERVVMRIERIGERVMRSEELT